MGIQPKKSCQKAVKFPVVVGRVETGCLCLANSRFAPVLIGKAIVVTYRVRDCDDLQDLLFDGHLYDSLNQGGRHGVAYLSVSLGSPTGH